VVSQDHSAVSVSTVRLGVQSRRPKAASPSQELEVRAAGLINQLSGLVHHDVRAVESMLDIKSTKTNIYS
jgi:hypothetical protein